MKAVGSHRPLPISDPEALLDLEVPEPQPPTGRDLLVAVRAVSVNPVDTKVRKRRASDGKTPVVLGFDAAGEVVAAGPECCFFRPGDLVWYAGHLERPGANAALQLVDERIVGRKPMHLDLEEAAALPLTALTAWEGLFERLAIPEGGTGRLLVVGGAGGVGSIAIQLARALTKLTVIATASRPESGAFCMRMGAHEVVDHSGDLAQAVEALGGGVDYVFVLSDPAPHFPALARLLAPLGKICAIVDATGPLDLNLLKPKSGTFAWEFMFTRPVFRTADLARQHEILDRVATLVDEGRLATTVTERLGPLSAATLRRAHERIESGHTVGKLVLAVR